MPTLIIPAAWRSVAGITQDAPLPHCQATTVRAAVDWLTEAYPMFRQRIFNERGQVASWVNIYAGDTNIRQAQGLDTPVTDATEIVVLPAVAGG